MQPWWIHLNHPWIHNWLHNDSSYPSSLLQKHAAGGSKNAAHRSDHCVIKATLIGAPRKAQRKYLQGRHKFPLPPIKPNSPTFTPTDNLFMQLKSYMPRPKQKQPHLWSGWLSDHKEYEIFPVPRKNEILHWFWLDDPMYQPQRARYKWHKLSRLFSANPCVFGMFLTPVSLACFTRM